MLVLLVFLLNNILKIVHNDYINNEKGLKVDVLKNIHF